MIDTSTQDSEIQRLEKLVNALLTRFTELKKERDNLLETVKKRETTIEEREETITARDATIEEQKTIIEDRELTIIEREESIEMLETKINDKNSERSKISEKVNNIMDQIESWEQSLELGEYGDDNSNTSQQEMF